MLGRQVLCKCFTIELHPWPREEYFLNHREPPQPALFESEQVPSWLPLDMHQRASYKLILEHQQGTSMRSATSPTFAPVLSLKWTFSTFCLLLVFQGNSFEFVICIPFCDLEMWSFAGVHSSGAKVLSAVVPSSLCLACSDAGSSALGCEGKPAGQD